MYHNHNNHNHNDNDRKKMDTVFSKTDK